MHYGTPFLYNIDSHSIFRFVQGRDSAWRKHHTFTEEADRQWKQVMGNRNIKVTCVLSRQAKGKTKRPYGWLQDRVIRNCARGNATGIRQARGVLNHEVHRYNYNQLHATTQELPYFLFQRALKERMSLFREFRVKRPFQLVKDIYCLRVNGTIDSYRRNSINNLRLKVNNTSYLSSKQ